MGLIGLDEVDLAELGIVSRRRQPIGLEETDEVYFFERGEHYRPKHIRSSGLDVISEKVRIALRILEKEGIHNSHIWYDLEGACKLYFRRHKNLDPNNILNAIRKEQRLMQEQGGYRDGKIYQALMEPFRRYVPQELYSEVMKRRNGH